MTDRPKEDPELPPGYEIEEGGRPIDGSTYYIPRADGLGRRTFETRRQAARACIAHRNRIAAEALREAADAIEDGDRTIGDYPSPAACTRAWLRARADDLEGRDG